MSFVAAAIATATIGGVTSYLGGKEQASAARNASQDQMAMFNTINQQEKPYREAGYGALNTIADKGSYFNTPMTQQDLINNLAPSYEFMLNQGQQANKNLANSTGGLIGGNALQGLDTFTQNYALNAGQNAFNNYQTQQQNIFNRLASIAGIGQTGQLQTNQAATNAINQSTGYNTSAAAANAAGLVGAGNAINTGLTNLGSWYAVNGGGSPGGFSVGSNPDPYGTASWPTAPTF